MTYQELKESMAMIEKQSYAMEQLYMNNGGEITEATENMEAEIEALKTLLANEGTDMLGRWLKAKEDRKKALKAEKDYLTRQINSIDRGMDFIKSQINWVMGVIGEEKVRGNKGYSFTKTDSVTTSVNKESLNILYKDKVAAAVKDIIPEDVTITLGASVKMVPEGKDLPVYYEQLTRPTVRFSKPRLISEDDE